MGQYGRGQHPNSKANLRPNIFTSETGREAQARSIESAKHNKTLRDMLEKALSKEIENVSGEKATKKEVSCIMLANEMAKGNLKAIKLGAKILGELQDRVDITSSDNTLQIEIVPSRREGKSE